MTPGKQSTLTARRRRLFDRMPAAGDIPGSTAIGSDSGTVKSNRPSPIDALLRRFFGKSIR